MSFVIQDLDLTIIALFLTANLALGILAGRGIKTLRDYAVGDRNFSTATIAATIVATWISGSAFVVNISETYKQGFWHAAAVSANALDLLIIGLIFAPRMKEFLGRLSVAEAMGSLYGPHMRTVTSIAAIAQAVGRIALQVKVFSTIFSYFLGVDNLHATIASTSVVIAYSSIGGIKSVTFTDLLQFFTFGVFIPMLTLVVWSTFGDADVVTRTVATNPDFSYAELLNSSNPKFYSYLFLFFYYMMPSLDATIFQRILMAKDTKQIRMSFTIAAVVCLFITVLMCFIGMVLFTNSSTTEHSKIILRIFELKDIPGFVGVIIISMIAMVMSTADSWINASSVTFAHDICRGLKISEDKKLWIARGFAVLIGASAVAMALHSTNLLQLLLLSANFYMPIVTVPLILAIFGFRTTPKAIFIAIFGAISTVIIWKIYIQPTTGIDSVMPAMFVNMVLLFLSHYLLGQTGGWIGILDASDLNAIKRERREDVRVFWSFVKDFPTLAARFNFRKYCLKYVPRNEASYLYFAIVTLFSTLFMGILHSKAFASTDNMFLVFTMQAISLIIAAIFFGHKLWSKSLREKYVGLLWYFSIFVVLAFISGMMVLICKFSQLAFMVFVLDLMIIGTLLNWKNAIGMMSVGSYISFILYGIFIGTPEFTTDIASLQSHLIFTLLLVSSFLVAFIRPTQEALAVAEAKSKHLWEKIIDMDKELHKAEFLKTEFLNNISHEVRTPMTGITSMGQVLYDNYDKLSEKQRKECVRDIAKSSDRLFSLMTNILDLSSLTSLKLELNLQPTDLGELVKERVRYCQKMYLEDKKLEFDLHVDKGLFVLCDAYHMSHTIDNLVMNAIAYSKPATTIIVHLHNVKGNVEFSIRDEGVGVPPTELYDIFRPFTVSSKTRSPAGGRGVGLALCHSVVTSHSGKIWAESDGKSWAEFKFSLRKA